MTDTGRFQELSPTKLQEILDNAVPEKTKKATKFGMNIFNGTYLEVLLLLFTTWAGRQSKSSPTAENGMVLSHSFLGTTRKRKSAVVEPWNALPKNNATRCRVF